MINLVSDCSVLILSQLSAFATVTSQSDMLRKMSLEFCHVRLQLISKKMEMRSSYKCGNSDQCRSALQEVSAHI